MLQLLYPRPSMTLLALRGKLRVWPSMYLNDLLLPQNRWLLDEAVNGWGMLLAVLLGLLARRWWQIFAGIVPIVLGHALVSWSQISVASVPIRLIVAVVWVAVPLSVATSVFYVRHRYGPMFGRFGPGFSRIAWAALGCIVGTFAGVVIGVLLAPVVKSAIEFRDIKGMQATMLILSPFILLSHLGFIGGAIFGWLCGGRRNTARQSEV